jgi:hypothetical protein
MMLARICEAIGLSHVAMWLRAKDQPLLMKDATVAGAVLQVHSFHCPSCEGALVDGDEVRWLQWPNGERSGMFHKACFERVHAEAFADHHRSAPDREPEPVVVDS